MKHISALCMQNADGTYCRNYVLMVKEKVNCA